MTGRFVTSLLGICVSAANSAGALNAQSVDDAQDLIFFGPLRPVAIRLHLYIDGQPFRETWRAYDQKELETLDVNHDGRIDTDETAKAIPTLSALMSGSGAVAGDRPLGRYTSSSGGSASIADCLAWRESSADGPFSVTESAAAALSDGALLALIDRDRDGRLAREELAGAPDVLRRRDFDNNEALTRPELISGAALYESVSTNSAATGAPAEKAGANADPDGSRFLFVVARQATADDVAQAILGRYDRDRNGCLTEAVGGAREIALPPEIFRSLDTNGDQTLDALELAKFRDRGPDVELSFEFGRLTSGIPSHRPEAARDDDGGADSAEPQSAPFRVRERSDGSYRLDLPDAQIDIRRDNSHPTKNRPQDFSFRAFDGDNNRYLDAKESERVIGKAPLALIDADANGMVTETEFDAFITREGDAAGAKLVLALTGQGQNLFDQIDANLDGGLTPRELQTAAERMASQDTNGDGYLDGDELPQKVTLLLARGRLRLATVTANATMRRPRGTTRVEEEVGPPWFRKMDRNRDGDLSPREFLGPSSTFEKYDANHDGLIDAAEAESY